MKKKKNRTIYRKTKIELLAQLDINESTYRKMR